MISTNKDYIEVAEKLLEIARKSDYDKTYVQSDELCALIGAGAEIKTLNMIQINERYIHRVVYQRKVFVNSTEEPLTFQISGYNRKSDSEIKRERRISSEELERMCRGNAY